MITFPVRFVDANYKRKISSNRLKPCRSVAYFLSCALPCLALAQSPANDKSGPDSMGKDIGKQSGPSGGAESSNPDALDYSYIGLGLEHKGDLKGAVLAYSKAISIRQDNYVLAYESRAIIEEQMGNFEDALSDYTKFISLEPNDSSGYLNRAMLKRDQGDLDGSLADYNRAIQLDPSVSQSYEGRGLIKKLKGDMDGALADYNQAIKLEPNGFEAYERRAETRKLKGDLEGSSADLAVVEVFKQAQKSGASIFIAKIDPDQTTVGQDIVVTLELGNLYDENFSLPKVEGLEVVHCTVNEIQRQWPLSSTFAHQFVLHAIRPGKFIIPAFDIRSSQTSVVIHVLPVRVDVLDQAPAASRASAETSSSTPAAASSAEQAPKNSQPTSNDMPASSPGVD